MYQCFVAVGRLGRDPHVTTTPTGIRVATFSLATSEYVKGEERTEWHRVVVWDDKLIEALEKRAAKGTLVAIEGQIRTRKWEKDGREGSTTEVVLDRFGGKLRVLNGTREAVEAAPAAEPRGEARAETPKAKGGRTARPAPDLASFEDDLPF